MLESSSPKQKLGVLQILVGDGNELAYVKRGHYIARGNPPLDVNSYLELLLAKCSTHNNSPATSMKYKQNAYTKIVKEYNYIQSHDL
jgi:hypothetical protein